MSANGHLEPRLPMFVLPEKTTIVDAQRGDLPLDGGDKKAAPQNGRGSEDLGAKIGLPDLFAVGDLQGVQKPFVIPEEDPTVRECRRRIHRPGGLKPPALPAVFLLDRQS